MDVTELRLRERTALLVGPLSRTHQAIAYKLSQMGADVVLASQDLAASQRFAQQILEAREIQEKFGRAQCVPWEGRTLAGARESVSRAAHFFGGIDILIESAPSRGSCIFAEEDLNDLSGLLEQNLAGALYATQAVLPFLKGRKRGRVIYLGHELEQGFAGFSLMAAARSGLWGFVQSLARELTADNITINGVIQGLCEDYKTTLEPRAAQAMLGELRERFPQAQFTDPERIANAVVFLASNLGTGVSGQLITVRNGDFFSLPHQTKT